MSKKSKLIEPIPATMQEVVKSFFANHPKPRNPKKDSGGGPWSRQDGDPEA